MGFGPSNTTRITLAYASRVFSSNMRGILSLILLLTLLLITNNMILSVLVWRLARLATLLISWCRVKPVPGIYCLSQIPN